MQIGLLQERIKELEGQMMQAIAQYNALSGQKQECELWLLKLKTEAEKQQENDAA